MLTRAKDCGEFWSISYCFTNKSGEKYETYGPKMRFDISKVNGTILDYPPYRPGTKYGNLYDKGKLLDIPEEYVHLLPSPGTFFALDCKAKRCASLLLERGASVTRPDAFNKIAIQWAEETRMPTIADKIERANKDLGILAGLEITNAILRLCPPGSIVIPPTDVPLVVICEDEKDFGREKRKYAEAIPWPKHYSVLGVSTNGPYPTFEYEIQANGVRKTFGGMLSRHRGYYVITNSWINHPLKPPH